LRRDLVVQRVEVEASLRLRFNVQRHPHCRSLGSRGCPLLEALQGSGKLLSVNFRARLIHVSIVR